MIHRTTGCSERLIDCQGLSGSAYAAQMSALCRVNSRWLRARNLNLRLSRRNVRLSPESGRPGPHRRTSLPSHVCTAPPCVVTSTATTLWHLGAGRGRRPRHHKLTFYQPTMKKRRLADFCGRVTLAFAAVSSRRSGPVRRCLPPEWRDLAGWSTPTPSRRWRATRAPELRRDGVASDSPSAKASRS